MVARTVLVVAEPAVASAALRDLGVSGWLVPAGPGRTAVLPESMDPPALAALLADRAGLDTLSAVVRDPGAIFLRGYRRGSPTLDYCSDRAVLVDWFRLDSGVLHYQVDGADHPGSAPAPRGPGGVDAAALAVFGVGTVDPDRLGRMMRGEFDRTSDAVPAEFQYRLIMTALNLDPTAVTTSFDRVPPHGMPGAVRVAPPARAVPPTAGPAWRDGFPAVRLAGFRATGFRAAEPFGWRSIPLAVHVDVPDGVSESDLAGTVADAVTGGEWPVRAEVAVAGQVPGAASAWRLAASMAQRGRVTARSAVLFVTLHTRTGRRPGAPDPASRSAPDDGTGMEPWSVAVGGGRPSDRWLVDSAMDSIAAAFRVLYGLRAPRLLSIDPDGFAFGTARADVRILGGSGTDR